MALFALVTQRAVTSRSTGQSKGSAPPETFRPGLETSKQAYPHVSFSTGHRQIYRGSGNINAISRSPRNNYSNGSENDGDLVTQL